MHSTGDTTPDRSPNPQPPGVGLGIDRLVGTWVLVMLCIGFHQASICGCHFHAMAVFPTLIPIGWAIFLLASYRHTLEHVAAWITFLFAVLWLWVGFESNIKFAFM